MGPAPKVAKVEFEVGPLPPNGEPEGVLCCCGAPEVPNMDEVPAPGLGCELSPPPSDMPPRPPSASDTMVSSVADAISTDTEGADIGGACSICAGGV